MLAERISDPPCGNSCLDDKIGPSTPQQFLDDDDVLGVLNDRYP